MRLVSRLFWCVLVWTAALMVMAFPLSANAQSGVTTLPDLNGDGKSDLLRINPANGQTMAWLMEGNASVGSASLLADPAWKVIKTADLNGDRNTDLIVYNQSTGQTFAWIMSGTTVTAWTLLRTDPDWKVTETADLNGDGKSDLLWNNASTGQTAAWLMNGSAVTSSTMLLADADWKVVATADLNGDRNADLIWYNATLGQTAAWLMNGRAVISSTMLLTDANWKVVSAADFNGDGKADLLWYNASTGRTATWLMDGTSIISWSVLPTDPNWKVAAIADLDGDGKSDIVFNNPITGQKIAWLINGISVSGSASLLTSFNWNLAAAADLNGDGKSDLLWYNSSTGQTASWLMSGTSPTNGATLFTDPNWRLKCIKGTSVTTGIACDDSVFSAATGTMPVNQAPIVNAGADQSITLPAAANLAGNASDDGTPIALLISMWSQVSGPGVVTFGNASSLNTTGTFSVAGSYTLRLTTSDTLLTATDDVMVIVAAANQAPIVNAGPDQTITFPAAATLAGTATDDGLPNGSTLTRTWSKVSGPGSVTFGNVAALNSTATFSVAESYTLRLTVSDGSLSTSDDIIITVVVVQACGSTVSGTHTLSATATDNVGVVGVQLQLDGTNLGAELTTFPYSIQWNTTTASNGCHTLSAVARDAAGNRGTASLQVTVSNALTQQQVVTPLITHNTNVRKR